MMKGKTKVLTNLTWNLTNVNPSGDNVVTNNLNHISHFFLLKLVKTKLKTQTLQVVFFYKMPYLSSK